MKIEHRDPADLKPDREIKALHPIDPQDPEYIALVESIKRDGIQIPLHVGPGNGTHPIWLGHRRHSAARQLQLDRVPVIIHAEEDDREMILFTDEVLKRDGSPSARVWRTRGWWKKIIERARLKRVDSIQKPLISSLVSNDTNGSRLPAQTAEELADLTGIPRVEFFRCKEVEALFAEQPEVQAKWEPKLLSGKCSFWNILSGTRGGEEAHKKNAGRTPEEFRNPASDQCYKTMLSIGRRVPDWQKLSGQDRKKLRGDLARMLVEGNRPLTPDQLAEAAAMCKEMGEDFKQLAKLAEESGKVSK